MSGLYATLNSTVKALAAHSRAIETTGKNLANVNNTAYARQRVIYGDRGTVMTPTGPESMGIEALGIQQLREQLLDQQVSREVSLSEQFKAEQRAYQRAQAGLGQGIDRTQTVSATGATADGMAAALDNFFNSFESLATNPTDSGQRQNVLQNAQILTDTFHQVDDRLEHVQSDLDTQVSTDVDSVNSLLSSIADLNIQIGRFEINAPGAAVDLRDQRQAKLEALAAKLPVTVADAGAGQVQLLAKDSGGASVVLVDKGTVQATLAYNGTQIVAGAAATPLALGTGAIKGTLDARTGAVQTLRDSLDALAQQIVTSVNGAYAAAGGNFFAPAGTTAATINLVGTLTSSTLQAGDGSAAGDNSVATAIADLATTPFSTAGGDAIDGTFSGFFAATVSGIGQALSGANANVEDQGNIEKLVRTQRDAVSGVSLDEELADLMKYQRAFQASSRVFNTIDELIDTVVNRMGA